MWSEIVDEAKKVVSRETVMYEFYSAMLLKHSSLSSTLANLLAIKLENSNFSASSLNNVFTEVFSNNNLLEESVEKDLRILKDKDPVTKSLSQGFLYSKGFLALQAHRINKLLWLGGREEITYFIRNQVSKVLGVDIHPGARLGEAVIIDHATGVVIGETTVVGNNVQILHNVTLGSTGKPLKGDRRHPTIGDGVQIGAGALILGNVTVGFNAKIGVGAVVVKDVPTRTTVVGTPTDVVVKKK